MTGALPVGALVVAAAQYQHGFTGGLQADQMRPQLDGRAARQHRGQLRIALSEQVVEAGMTVTGSMVFPVGESGLLRRA